MPQDLFRQIGVRPGGQNGYEEYVQAAQITSDPVFRELSQARPTELEDLRRELEDLQTALAPMSPEQRAELEPEVRNMRRRIAALEKQSVPKTQLQMRREWVQRFPSLWTWVERGNAKPAFDPRTQVGINTLFPELAGFKAVVRFGVAKANVELADGNGARAAQTLADAYKFSARIGASTLIHRLVSISCISILNAELLNLLPALPDRGADGIIAAIEENLPAQPWALRAFQAEAANIPGVVDAIVDDPNMINMIAIAEPDDAGDPRRADLWKRFDKLSVQERKALLVSGGKIAANHVRGASAMLAQPEAAWFAPEAEVFDGTMEGLIAEMLASSFPQVAQVEARSRTQSRLARASVRIVQFRWHFGRMPQTLEEALPAAWIADPLSGKAFLYEVQGNAFTIKSLGNAKTGEIALKQYARSPAGAKDPSQP